MEQLSKEEVLRSVVDKSGDFFQLSELSDYFDGSASTVLSAMDAYAKQNAIAFMEAYQLGQIPFEKEPDDTEELYELFLQSINK